MAVLYRSPIELRHLLIATDTLQHLSLRRSLKICPLVKVPLRHLGMETSVQCATQEDAQIELRKKKCVPCESKDLRPMIEKAANELLQQIPGWKLVNEGGQLKLQRSWKAKSFTKGLDFFKLVGDVAESEGHHPDLHLVNWNNVSIEIWTHAVGGLTENDFILAAKISALDVEGLFRKRATGAKSSAS